MKKILDRAVIQKVPLKQAGDPMESAFPVPTKPAVDKREKLLAPFAGRRGVRPPRRRA